MEKLNKIYESIAKNKDRWSYYSNCDLEILGVWNDSDDALKFIKDYFEIGGKSCLSNFEDKDFEVKKRAKHTISTFLLGIKLAECLFDLSANGCSRINNLNKDFYSAEGFNFKYFWFLSCLYHDIGYIYENNNDEALLNDVKTEGLQHFISDAEAGNICKTFDKSEVDLYLKGRAILGNDGKGCVDHGIYSGIKLYNRLKEQFDISFAMRTAESNNKSSFYINVKGRKLHVSDSHIKIYAQVANAIIAHNIWIDTLNNYKQFTNVEIARRDKINCKKDPLCFILCLADTLEPLKRCINLECVKLGALPNERGISIVLEMDDCCSGYNQYVNGIKKLGDWLDVEVNLMSNIKSGAMEARGFKAEIVLKERGNSNRN